jgi:gem associated protein 6
MDGDETSEEVNDIHNIFIKDPEELVGFVYKEVRLTCTDGAARQGWVYTVDPVSECVVLVRFGESNSLTMEIVLQHAIKEMTIVDHDSEKHRAQLDQLFLLRGNDSAVVLSKDETLTKRDKVKEWLLQHRIPVEVSSTNCEVLVFSDVLTVHPPYTADSCLSTNEIVLSRIQDILKQIV